MRIALTREAAAGVTLATVLATSRSRYGLWRAMTACAMTLVVGSFETAHADPLRTIIPATRSTSHFSHYEVPTANCISGNVTATVGVGNWPSGYTGYSATYPGPWPQWPLLGPVTITAGGITITNLTPGASAQGCSVL